MHQKCDKINYKNQIYTEAKMKKYDAIIIGFGKGGKTLAGFLAGNRINLSVSSNRYEL